MYYVRVFGISYSERALTSLSPSDWQRCKVLGRFHEGRWLPRRGKGSGRAVSEPLAVIHKSANGGLASLIKSGTDFRDLSEAILELKEQPEGSIRRRTIVGLTGKARYVILCI